MIYVYKNILSTDTFIADSVLEFDERTLSKVKRDKHLITLVEDVEQATYVDGDLFQSKRFNTSFRLADISAGCKTLLNIVANPNKIYSTIECGYNIFEYLYRENTGRINTKSLPLSNPYNATFIGIVDDVEVTAECDLNSIKEWLYDE